MPLLNLVCLGKVVIIVLGLDFLQEVLVLLPGSLLRLNAVSLVLQNLKLFAFTLNLSLSLFVFLLELGDILVASSHHFGIVI